MGGSLSLSIQSGLQAGDIFYIVIDNSSDAVSGTFAGLAQGATFVQGGDTFKVSYNANWSGNPLTSSFSGGNDVAVEALAVVPEPSAFVSLFGGAGMLLGIGRMRRRSS